MMSGAKKPRVFLILFNAWTILGYAAITISTPINQTLLEAVEPGDIILGGLFPVHMTKDNLCDEINPDRGIQRLEAMLFAVDEINQRTDILPGIKLGTRILDTCSKETYALEQALEFIKSSLSDSENGASGGYFCEGGGKIKRMEKTTKEIRGVVGGSYSTVSIQVANLFRLFNIPQISYASTSARLSEKQNHPLFARTVPSDVDQAKGIAALVAHFNWSFVSTVRSSGDYGESGIDAFWKESVKVGVCIAAREVIKRNPTAEEMDSIVRLLFQDFAKARVVVLFTRVDHTKALLDAARRENITHHFVWISADGWGRELGPVANNTDIASGAITFEVKTEKITNFTHYFTSLDVNDNKRNPWFKTYLAGAKCTTNWANKQFPHCSLTKVSDRIRDFKQESKVQFVYDAVYAFAWALDTLQNLICSEGAQLTKSDCIDKITNYNGKELYKIIVNSTFHGKNE